MEQKSERRGNVEVRLLKDGGLDEIVMWDDADKCIFHMEKTHESGFWMRAYGTEEDVVVHLWAKTGPVMDDYDRPAGDGPIVEGSYEWDVDQEETKLPLRRGNVEVRLNRDGSLDELVVSAGETCVFHMEMMSESHFWMRAYGTGADLVADIYAETGPRTDVMGEPVSDGPVLKGTWEWEEPFG